METQLANIELQLGQKLTENEHSLMELWCMRFKGEPEKPSLSGAPANDNPKPKS
jgi:hypothetical protein